MPARHITSPGLPDLVPLGRALGGRPAREGSLVTDTSQIAPADPAAGGGQRTGSLSALRLPELQAVAAQLGISGTARMRKSDLVEAIKARESGGGTAPAAETAPAGSAPSNGASANSTPAPRPAPRTRGRRAGAPAGPPAPRAAENGAAAERRRRGRRRADQRRGEQRRGDSAARQQTLPLNSSAEQPASDAEATVDAPAQPPAASGEDAAAERAGENGAARESPRRRPPRAPPA